MADDLTLGELSRRMRDLKEDQRAEFERLNQRLDGMQFVHKDVYITDTRNMEMRVKRLEDGISWALRTAAGALIISPAGALVTYLLLRQ